MRLLTGLILATTLVHGASAMAQSVTATGTPTAPIDQSLGETAKGHGAFSIAYLQSYVDGLRISDSVIARNGKTHSHTIEFDFDWFFADHWSLHVGLPYISNKYEGPAPHCPTSTPAPCKAVPALNPQHPESRFLDDGEYHATFQDFNLGVAWHTTVAETYLLTPALNVYLPSHDYTFFANAAVGQRLWKVEPSLELAHQFDFSNVYYRIQYGYVLTESTLGTNVNHHRLYLELGWFLNERLSIRGFAAGKKGNGYVAGTLVPLTQGFTNELWYHHDQISKHNYGALGAGLDYRLGERYTLSASVQRLVWGQTVFNFRYAGEVRLSREF